MDSQPADTSAKQEHESCLTCDFLDLRHFVEVAFQTGRTPLVIDTSPDEKVVTYYSYQTDSIILESKTMIIQLASISLQAAMETGRMALANAMRYGKTLIIRLGQATPDFRNTFNDKNLASRTTGASLGDNSLFPEEVFVEAGRLLHGDCPAGRDWATRLMRADDMFPHKNIAICRDEFRVMIVSQIPMDSLDEYLFGEEWGGLPDKGLFTVLEVTHSDEDVETDARHDKEIDG